MLHCAFQLLSLSKGMANVQLENISIRVKCNLQHGPKARVQMSHCSQGKIWRQINKYPNEDNHNIKKASSRGNAVTYISSTPRVVSPFPKQRGESRAWVKAGNTICFGEERDAELIQAQFAQRAEGMGRNGSAPPPPTHPPLSEATTSYITGCFIQ